MKSFVREQGPTVAAMVVATLAITALAGGSTDVLYPVSFAVLAIGLWWEVRRGAL
jgi:hypothetical protein